MFFASSISHELFHQLATCFRSSLLMENTEGKDSNLNLLHVIQNKFRILFT